MNVPSSDEHRPVEPGKNPRPPDNEGATVADTDAPTLQSDTVGAGRADTAGPTLAEEPHSGDRDDGPPAGAERYQLKEVHARGGLGRIWVAHDPAIGRDVAFKEILPEWSRHASAARRFAREARITGRLEHPGIVPVYELSRRPGTGQPFYTMRFVQGRTLSQAIRLHHESLRAGRDSEVERQTLLSAFVSVANAVAYANSRGVVHRDLKGENVILGDFGEVILLDWGIAKVLSDPAGAGSGDEPTNETGPAAESDRGGTLAGQVLGTPAFMAPEQARGEIERIGPRTDVYGLGAMLYEILAGRPPFSGATTVEILEKVIHSRPPAPRSVAPHATRALEAVCLRAMEPDPDQRYATAGELAAEVRRFLADEPVEAWREPWIVRARRWARRHRTWVTGAGMFLVAGVFALSVGTVLLSRKQAEIERQRVLAEDNFKLARRAVDQYLTRVGGSPELKAPGLEGLRRNLFGAAREFYDEFARRRGNDRRSRADLADASVTLADIEHRLGRDPAAEALYRKAVEIYEGLLAELPGHPALVRGWCAALGDMAQFQSLTGRGEQAEASFRRVLDVRRTLANGPEDPELLRILASAHDNLGAFLNRLRRFAEAEAAHLEGLRLRERLSRIQPDEPAHASTLVMSHVNLIGLFATSGRVEAAAPHVRDALDLAEQAAGANPDQPEARHHLSTALNNIGGVCVLTGRPAEARKAYQRALALREELLREHPTVREYQFALATSHINLGELEVREGQPKVGLEGLDRGLAVLRDILSREPRHALARANAAYASAWRARALDRAGMTDQVLPTWERAAAFDDLGDPDLRAGRARALARHGKPDQALAELDRLAKAENLGPECLIEALEAAGHVASARGSASSTEPRALALVLLRRLEKATWLADPSHRRALLENPALAPLVSDAEFRRMLGP